MPSPHAALISTYTANLLRLYREEVTDADKAAGLPWYPNATRIMREWSAAYRFPLVTVASITAALSPQLEWSRNLIIADDILAGRYPSIGGALHTNIDKAERIYRGAALFEVFKAAPKVTSFAINLAGDYRSAVTVDTHAAQAASGSPLVTPRLTVPAYDAFANAYHKAAEEIGIEPAMFQAVVWHAWKRKFPPEMKRVIRRQW